MNFQDRDDIYAVAGEYVLGLLSADEAADIERLLHTNAEVAAAVHYWEERLAGLNAIAAPVTPPPDLWQRIERDLPAPVRADMVPLCSPGLWDNIRFWRLTSALGLAAAIFLAVFTFALDRPRAAPTIVVVLVAPDRTPGWLIQADATHTVQSVPLVHPTVGPQQALQLWTLTDPARGPVSLGLVPPDRPVSIPAQRLPGLVPGQLFEVTLEPATGSSIGRPTGPILFLGRAVALR